ncbi:hypothetical protein AHAS_Ahas17G0135900 [Arachis hypogaea]
MGFGALGHIPELNVSHTLLRELIRCFDVYQECLDTLYGKIYKTLAKIRDAGGELAEIQEDFRRLHPEVLLIANNSKHNLLGSQAACPSCGDSLTMELGVSCAELLDQGDQNPESRKETFG